MFRAILGLIPALLLGIILFLINPILGVLWVMWLVVLVFYVVRKDVIIKFLRWLFRANK